MIYAVIIERNYLGWNESFCEFYLSKQEAEKRKTEVLAGNTNYDNIDVTIKGGELDKFKDIMTVRQYERLTRKFLSIESIDIEKRAIQ